MVEHPSWPELIRHCFSRTQFMALATCGKNGPWVNPVYFSWDDRFCLYFISQMNCLHMANIAESPQVSCAIFPTDQTGDVFGGYVSGTAELLADAEKIKASHIYYDRVYPNDPDHQKRRADSYYNDPTWHFVRIKPTGLWYFDTRYFEETRVAVPQDIWNYA